MTHLWWYSTWYKHSSELRYVCCVDEPEPSPDVVRYGPIFLCHDGEEQP